MSASRIKTLDKFTRTQLSPNFFMRDFLFSETAAILGLSNIPKDKKLAIAAGKGLCQNVLEPILAAWGAVHIRSAYRSEEVNQAGNALKAGCSGNKRNYARHIWDRKELGADGIEYMGATACIIIPGYLDYFEKSGDWTSLAWWIHHHIDAYSSMTFYPNLCAFNIRWFEDANKPKNIATQFVDPKTGSEESILKHGVVSPFYADMPQKQRYEACVSLLNQG